jgi:hypothetical protein
VPQVLEMHPDLMGPPGVQLQPKQVYHLKPGHHPSVGSSRTTLRGNTHSFAVALTPCDRRVHADRAGVQMAPRQRRVASMHPARRDGGAELSVGKIGLGDDHETGGVPVEAMDNARPSFGASGQGGAPSYQGVDERVVPVAGRRVHYQAGRLVDDGQVLVLEDEHEGNGGGLERSRRFVVRDPNGYNLTPGKEPGCASNFPINGNALVCHQARRLGSGDRHLVGEEPIETLGFRTDDGEFDLASWIWLERDI